MECFLSHGRLTKYILQRKFQTFPSHVFESQIMPLLGPAPVDARDLLAEVLELYHPDLVSAGVTIYLAFANSEGNGPPVKLHGYPKAAVVRINAYAKRVEGLTDATITVDGDEWPNWSDEERAALMDHEAFHLEVVRDKKTSQYKTDNAGRPKLKMRLHDYEMGGFDLIARRHGKAAFEVQAARTFKDQRGQLYWDWNDDNAPDAAMPEPRLLG